MLYVVHHRKPHGRSEPDDAFANALKTAGPWAEVTPGMWLLQAHGSANEVRQMLRRSAADDDELFIARLAGEWAGTNLAPSRYSWLCDIQDKQSEDA